MTITQIARNYRISRRVVSYYVETLKTKEGMKFKQDPVTRTHYFDSDEVTVIEGILEERGYHKADDAV